MDIAIDLNGLKKTEATKIKIDELVDQIKELCASEDCGDKAAAIIFYDYNERAKKDELTAYTHGNAAALGYGMIKAIISATKSGSKTEEAQIALLITLAAELIDKAYNTAKTLELGMLALSAKEIVKKYMK